MSLQNCLSIKLNLGRPLKCPLNFVPKFGTKKVSSQEYALKTMPSRDSHQNSIFQLILKN